MEAFAEVAAVRGKIVVYGLLDGGSTPVPWFPILAKSLSIIGYKILDYFESPTMGTPPEPEKADAAVAFIHSQLASGALVPVIARTFPLEEIVEAQPVHGVEPTGRQDRGGDPLKMLRRSLSCQASEELHDDHG